MIPDDTNYDITKKKKNKYSKDGINPTNILHRPPDVK